MLYMFIPITLYVAKRVEKLSYGFSILEKLVVCAQENQISIRYDDFLNFVNKNISNSP